MSDLEYDYINPYDSSSRINAVVLIEYLLQAALCASFLLTLHWFPFLVMAPVTYYHVKLYVLLSFSLYVNFSIVLSSLDTICSTWLDSPLDCFFIHGNNTLKLSRNLHVTARNVPDEVMSIKISEINKNKMIDDPTNSFREAHLQSEINSKRSSMEARKRNK